MGAHSFSSKRCMKRSASAQRTRLAKATGPENRSGRHQTNSPQRGFGRMLRHDKGLGLRMLGKALAKQMLGNGTSFSGTSLLLAWGRRII